MGYVNYVGLGILVLVVIAAIVRSHIEINDRKNDAK